MFRWPHHCRSCGNLVCHPCSPEVAVLYEMKEAGEVRVCTLCYWGQDPVHASYKRKVSRDSDSAHSFGNMDDVTQKKDKNNDHDTGKVSGEKNIDYFYTEPEKQEFVTAYKNMLAILLHQCPYVQNVIPEPAFVIECTNHKNNTYNHANNIGNDIYVNICCDDCISDYSLHETKWSGQFYISNDVLHIRYNNSSDNIEHNDYEDAHRVEIYHVLVNPKALKLGMSDIYAQRYRSSSQDEEDDNEHRNSTNESNHEVSLCLMFGFICCVFYLCVVGVPCGKVVG